MIAIKENGVIYIAYSAREMFCWGQVDEETMTMPENLFTFVANEENGVIVGVSYNMTRADALRYNLKKALDLPITTSTLYFQIQPEIEKILRQKGYMDNKAQDEANEKIKIFIAKQDKGFVYSFKGNFWDEVEEGITSPTDDLYFRSCYDVYRDITDVYERIEKIYKLYTKQTDTPAFPVVVIDTETKKHVVLGGNQ